MVASLSPFTLVAICHFAEKQNHHQEGYLQWLLLEGEFPSNYELPTSSRRSH